MLLLALAAIAATLAALLTVYFIAWYFWPLLAHWRKMNDPVVKATTEYQLMQQALSIEAQQNMLMRQRTEIGLLHLRTIHKDEAIFDATQQMLHQNMITSFVPSGQALLQAPLTQLLDLMTQLDGCDSILIVAKKGAGKSNLLRRIIDRRTNVSVLDPHASPGQWGAHQVIGAGLEFESINTMLHETTEAERRNRYKQLGQGVTQFPERTFCFDEMTEVTSEIDVAKPVQRLLNCRKVNMKVVMGGHSMNAADLGLNGKFNLLKNFDAVVRIDYNKATGERRYWICLQPQGHHDDFVECANPGLYVPPTVPAPVPTAIPTEDRTDGGQEQDSVGQKSPVTGDSILLNFANNIQDKVYFFIREQVRKGTPIDTIGRDEIKAKFGLKMGNNGLTTLTREAKERVMKEQQQS